MIYNDKTTYINNDATNFLQGAGFCYFIKHKRKKYSMFKNLYWVAGVYF